MRSRLWIALVSLALWAGPAGAKVFQSQREALETAFPEVDRVERRTHVLDAAQVEAVQSLARARLESKLVTVYTGVKDGRVVGYALIDIHTVRTLPEAFLVVISPEGEVADLRVLAFYEPLEYLPSARWLEQFRAERLSPELRLERKIHGIAGSTLSSRAVTGGVRRALALYEVLVRNGDHGGKPSHASGEAGALGR